MSGLALYGSVRGMHGVFPAEMRGYGHWLSGETVQGFIRESTETNPFLPVAHRPHAFPSFCESSTAILKAASNAVSCIFSEPPTDNLCLRFVSFGSLTSRSLG